MSARVPPNNREAEESVLGAMLLTKPVRDEMFNLLAPPDFFFPIHGSLFQVMYELDQEGRPADRLVLVDRMGLAGHAVTEQDILRLQTAAPISGHASQHASIVLRLAIARRTLLVLNDAAVAAWDGDTDKAAVVLERAHEVLAAPFDDIGMPVDALDLAEEDHNLDWIVNGLIARHEIVLIVAEPGCVAGDTELTINRAGKGFRCTIADAERMLHGGTRGGKQWDPGIPTMVARAVDGTVRSGLVFDVWQSGVKETWTLTTDAGRTIRATLDHPFLTPDGYRHLRDLQPGDAVCVNAGQGAVSPGQRKRYISTNTAFHPRQRRAAHGKHRMWTHRLVMEAHLNGLTFDAYVDALRYDEVRCKEFVYLTSDDVVHHIDEDHTNNDLANLALTTHPEHRRAHDWTGNVLHRVGVERVATIERYGDEMTYDLTVVGEPHNFLANGFVVRNSGKTTLLNQFAACCAAGLHPWTRHEIPRRRALVFDFQDSRGSRGRSVQHMLSLSRGRIERGWLGYELRTQGIDLTTRADQRWFEGKVTKYKPDIVIAGPLYNMVAGGPQRSKQSEETAQMAATFLAEMTVRRDCAMLVEAHAPHGEELRVRGSKLWEDWAGWGFGLRASITAGARQYDVVRFRGDRETGRQWPEQYVQGHPGHWPWEVPADKLPPNPTGGMDRLPEPPPEPDPPDDDLSPEPF